MVLQILFFVLHFLASLLLLGLGIVLTDSGPLPDYYGFALSGYSCLSLFRTGADMAEVTTTIRHPNEVCGEHCILWGHYCRYRSQSVASRRSHYLHWAPYHLGTQWFAMGMSHKK